MMRSITLRIPEHDKGGAAFDYEIYLAAKLYEDAMMTAGQAGCPDSRVVETGIFELMGKYGVSPFSTRIEDLIADIANV